MSSAETEYTYEAFISYRHLERDTAVAKQVQRALEGFRIPKQLQAAAKRAALGRCFRDEDELTPGSSLSDELREALAVSRFLIVICSPSTPTSKWVDEEVEAFIEQHGRKHVLTVLSEGEPEESLPHALRGDEPLAADFRPGKTRREQRLEELRLAAALIGCPLDALVQRQRQRQRRRIAAVTCIALALGGGFAAFAASQRRELSASERANQIQESEALASTSQDLLDQGLRMEAIQVAASALPQTDDASDRPFVASAQSALADALGVWPSYQTELVPLYSLSDVANAGRLQVSELGGWFALYDSPRAIRIVDVKTGSTIGMLTPPEDTAFDEDFLAKGSYLVCTLNGAELACYDAEKGKLLWRHETTCSSIAATEDATTLAAVVRQDAGTAAVALTQTATGTTLPAVATGHAYTGTESVFLSETEVTAVVASGATVTAVDLAGSGVHSVDAAHEVVVDALLEDGLLFVVSRAESESMAPTEATLEAFRADDLEPLWQESLSWESYDVGFADVPFDLDAHVVGIASSALQSPEVVVAYGDRMALLDAQTGTRNALLQTDSPITYCDLVQATGGTVVRAASYSGTRFAADIADPSTWASPSEIALPFPAAQATDVQIDGVRYVVALPAEKGSQVSVYRETNAEQAAGYAHVADALEGSLRFSTSANKAAWLDAGFTTLYVASPDHLDEPAAFSLDELGIGRASSQNLYLWVSEADHDLLLIANGDAASAPSVAAVDLASEKLVATWRCPDSATGTWSDWEVLAYGNGTLCVRIEGCSYLAVLNEETLSTLAEFELPSRQDAQLNAALPLGENVLIDFGETGMTQLFLADSLAQLDCDLNEQALLLPGSLETRSAVAADGSCLVLATTDELYCFEATGELRWSAPFNAETTCYLHLNDDASLLFAQDTNGACYLIDAATGTTLQTNTSVSVADDGIVTEGLFSADSAAFTATAFSLDGEPSALAFDLMGQSLGAASRIPGARGAAGTAGLALCQGSTDLYTLPLYDRAELLDLATETVAGHELTDEQRQAYGIE